MEEIKVLTAADRASIYCELLPQLKSLVGEESDVIANLSNIAAALKQVLSYVSWVGFYLLKNGELVLGPFQGKVACTRIKIGSGVCGAAAEERKTVVVPNVHEFPGHIFCDAHSKSEIVVPLLKGDKLLGVLDLDSSDYSAFNKVDADNLLLVSEIVSGLFSIEGQNGS